MHVQQYPLVQLLRVSAGGFHLLNLWQQNVCERELLSKDRHYIKPSAHNQSIVVPNEQLSPEEQ